MIWFYVLINAAVLLGAVQYMVKTGPRQIVPFALCIALLFIYCLITPVYFYAIDRQTPIGDEGLFAFVGKDIRGYYEKGMFFYMLANILFVFGFIWKKLAFDAELYKIREEGLLSLQKKVISLYGLFYLIVLTDIAVSGINPLTILVGSADESLFGHQSATNSYYFRNCADCIITTIVLFAYLKGKRHLLILITLMAFLLFVIMGFRYRIILTIIGLIMVYGMDIGSKLSAKKVLLVSMTIFYFLFFITYNRWNFIYGRFNELAYNPADFKYELFFDQTRGSLTDFNLMRYYEQNPGLDHDYGLTMFGYIFVKALPKFVFPKGEKPYPPPALQTLDYSQELPRYWARTGEATLHYGAFYGAFGWVGFVVMPFLMGLWLRFVVKRNPSSTPLGFLKQVVFSLALFQFVTRGYFPQFVDHFVYISLPVWVISRSLKKATILSHASHEAAYKCI
ncbi:O-antigen polymerase [Larkinella sp. VNQ87]|uniref:O-antigen polymerase n=1 Tax=Larkinella sp. VNQ87 TaxID=3400921 RepID=UPI003C11D2F3